MKRFHSPLQKIHNVFEQQCRLAQLELAQRQREWDEIIRLRGAADRACEEARQSLGTALGHQLLPNVLRGLQQHLGAAEDQRRELDQRLQRAALSVREAREKYQALRAREEGLARLIERQRRQHRQDQFHEQQRDLDDAAATRWNRLPDSGSEVVSHG